MKLQIKKIASLIGIIFSSLLILIMIPAIFQIESKEISPAIGALLIFLFLEFISVKSYLKSLKDIKISKMEELDRIFFRCLKENGNNLTVLKFAQFANLSGEKAREFLENKIVEFNGEVEVDDNAIVIYKFNSNN